MTLAYLKAGARLPEALETKLRGKLSAISWQPRAYFITNPCGEHVICDQVDEHKPPLR